MLPTLKQRYEQKKALVESLDTRELKKMGELLSGLGALIKPYDLPELQSGLQKATDDLSASISGKWNRIKAGSSGEVKANPTKLAKVASFQTAFVKGLKQLPHVLEIVRGLETSPKDEGEIIEAEAESSAEKKKVDLAPFPDRKPAPFKGDPGARDRVLSPKKEPPPNPVPKEPMDEPDAPEQGEKDAGKPEEKEKESAAEQSIRDGLSDKAYDRLKGIMLNAFSPPGFLAMFRGMPYVKDPVMVDEIFNLPRSKFEKLAADATKMTLKVPANQADIADIAKAAASQGQDGKAAKAITIEPAKGGSDIETGKDEPVAAVGAPETGSTGPAKATSIGGTKKPSIAASLGAASPSGKSAEKTDEPAAEEPSANGTLQAEAFAKKVGSIFKNATDKQVAALFNYLRDRGVSFK